MVVAGSMLPWATCSTVGCMGPLTAIDEPSGLEFGYGAVTLLAGLLPIGMAVIDRTRTPAATRVAVPWAAVLIILVALAAFVLEWFVLRSGETTVSALPAEGTWLVVSGAVVTAWSCRDRPAVADDQDPPAIPMER